MLGVIEGFDFLKGLPLVGWSVVTSQKDLEKFSPPFYLKADVVGHKTEMGAIFRCNNIEEAETNLQKIHKKFPKNKIVVQESFDGVEMIVGLKSDEVFGKLLVVGFGGIFAEVKKDISFRALPVSRRDIVQMIKYLRGVRVFKVRGKDYNLEKFVTLVEKVAYLGDKFDIKEMDLNPVIVGDKESKIVDVRVELK